MRPGMMGARKAPPQMLNRNSVSGSRPAQLGTSQGFVKVRLPMQSTNGKRPVVELVMLTNGKYQPIKFTNNRLATVGRVQYFLTFVLQTSNGSNTEEVV